ncbi:hypothetical protein MNBD_NITROSPIRAE01-511 [hydrothermal vent metagenome]|uniref:HTH merR-type domain-containing protein n=1 Tax=hydrothermal vent metagenome TaxID=652676 RepID=A0A3B1DM01_9ZZZZ
MQEKLFYKISDVCQLTGLEAYVVRFWETEFPMLHPKKSRGNQRIYIKKEIDLILEIKRLLYQEKLTIAGARKRLRQPTKKAERINTVHDNTLGVVKKELEDLLHLLN